MSLFGGVSGGGSGTAGPSGADGNTVLYGAGAPSAGVGVNGNFYIDTTAHAIYGPKVGGSWGSSTSLVGPQGSQGNQGNAGADGDQVIYGSGAPSNATGQDGDTYIDNVAHTLYGPKAAGAWPAGVSMVGPTGNAALTGLMIFGDGSDGDVTQSGQITLIRDMFYHNLTITNTGKIITQGWKIFVSGTLDISNAAANAITANGTDASQTTAATTAANISAFGAQSNNVGGGTSGSQSAAGSTTAGVQASAPVSPGTANGGAGGAGGAGGQSGTGNAGGALRAGGSPVTVVPWRRLELNLYRGTTLIQGGCGASGGSSGGGDGTNSSNAGAIASGAGGVVFLAARTIIRGASTAIGAISAKGAIAGRYATAQSTGNLGGYGGGGGGGGGWIMLVYETLTGTVAANALVVDGGDGSPGGNGVGTGKGGQGGSGGACGRVSVFDLGAQTSSEVVSPSATAAAATVPATITGSNGTTGIQGRASL